MFPLRDTNERSTFPFINYLIIAANIFVFYLQLSSPDFEAFVRQYAFTPANFSFFDLNSYFFILSSMFMHGSLLHILGNMWFLHIFGDNVEDRMGHFTYLLFYLLAGAAATFAQYILSTGSEIPMLGASGAISGVTGAYFIFFKRSTIKAIVPGFGLWSTSDLPATWFLGYWFLLQVFNGANSLNTVDGEGGVAWFAHIGGFVAGYLMAKLFPKRVDYS